MFPVISYSLLLYLYRLFQGYITSFFLFQGYICYTILYRGTKTAVYYFAIQQQHYRYTVTNKVVISSFVSSLLLHSSSYCCQLSPKSFPPSSMSSLKSPRMLPSRVLSRQVTCKSCLWFKLDNLLYKRRQLMLYRNS